MSDNKRIARNTIFLYIRMVILMCVGFYTSRVVLRALGVSDYGIYNLMGGVIGMLAYVNNIVAGGTSRFLSVELGRNDYDALRSTFAMANTLSICAALVIFFLGETVGLWFMMTHLNIAPSRMEAAGWVYQCALLSCCVTTLQSPYTASIIAHEKMDVYAYMSVLDVTLKLLIVFMLSWFGYDKLKLYAVLMLAVSVITVSTYVVIGMRLFRECRPALSMDRTRFRQMAGYSGWNMIGGFAMILNNYGLNILLNVFFGTVVNAARGIALQVSMIVQQLYQSIQTASRPQIIKYYAQKDVCSMERLVCNTSKYCAYLLLCLIIPIAFNVDDFLMVWLGQIPDYTSWFTRVILLQVLFQAIDQPVGMGIHAVGRMKLPNLTSALLYLSVFPLAYVAFHYGMDPITGYCVYLLFAPVIMIVDLFILKKYVGFSIHSFLNTVILPVFVMATVCSAFSFGIVTLFDFEGFLGFVLRAVLCCLFTVTAIYFFGIPRHVRVVILNKIKERLPI